jgi:hypothetical protein
VRPLRLSSSPVDDIVPEPRRFHAVIVLFGLAAVMLVHTTGWVAKNKAAVPKIRPTGVVWGTTMGLVPKML